ncbi:Calmodulin-binding receptor-like cytoplasmic kinase 2 [Carex littledalei]|uniref:Calmodulin-binding receptor-like cytoplasmic kinase 2 n=1 Tax=Carex littledalei TaxID=544730 RepID=A0A833VLX9_9POAL|nr:Calmodulin-binding receptor-like cytoplasmic kinase 2 [Carex littledalei]
MGSARMNDTSQTSYYSTKSSEFSNLSSPSVTTNFPESSHRQKKNMSDILLRCLASTNSADIRILLKKKMSLQVISGNVKFTWDDILKATNCFSSSLVIGEGGFSVVYKGKLQNGKEVAVKRAKKDVRDEQFMNESFRTEIETLQAINHMNLVGFYGYLLFEDEKIIVVEYVPNGNLREHLEYKPLIHRDIKSPNILLTSTLHGKVADFGLAKLASTDANCTVVQTFAKGTPGYIDPEYFRTNQLTSKSDVYSFGVVLVEIITGKRPIERTSKQTTVKWAMTEVHRGNAINTLDPKLEPNEAITVAVKDIYILASRCLLVDRRQRPTMEECSRFLWNVRKKYNDLIKKESNDN